MADALRSEQLQEGMRGGHLLTVRVSQRLGARTGTALGNRGFTPNALSVGNLVVGASTAAVALALLQWNHVAAAAVAFVGWQLAYVLDCADGQLARATGQGSPQGVVVDLLADYGTQAAVAVAVVGAAAPSIPDGTAGVLVTAVLVAGMLVNVYVSAMYTGLPNKPEDLKASSSLPVAVAKTIVRDYPAQLAVLSVAMALGGLASLVVVIGYSAINLLFVVARIASLSAERRREVAGR